MSETNPITPEELARLDALRLKVENAPFSSIEYDEALRFSYGPIRALIAQQAREIERLKARILAQKIAVDAGVAALKHYPKQIEALRAECAGLVDEGRAQAGRIAELERELAKPSLPCAVDDKFVEPDESCFFK